jgi:CDP-6-deoxy-D-xylo-4-hexulose-3-dehydrase
MYWRLQEDIIKFKEKKKLAKFILKTNRFTQFKEVKNFEEKYSKWQGCKYSVFVNSGSSANLLIIQAAKEIYKWKSDDEIIVPSVTWPTTITPVIQSNLKPIFVDCNLEDFSFDYEQLKKKISKKTKAIFVAHIIGFPANIQKIKKIIKNRNIMIFEDSCESQGAKFNNKKVGNFGVASSFSFYWGHHMTTIEGGMICTNNKNFYHICLLKRSHGLARELPSELHKNISRNYPNNNFKFLFLNSGFNLRNTEINAHLGNFQLPMLNKWINIRNRNYKYFYEVCNKFKKYLIINKNKGISSFVLPFIFRNKLLRINFEKELKKQRIESRPFIAGNLLRQPFLKNYLVSDCVNADFLHTNAIYIGNNQFVTMGRLKKLEIILRNFFKKI